MSKTHKPFSVSGRIKSFGYAIRGIIDFFKEEHNAIIHLTVTIFVIIIGIWLSITINDWMLIVFAIGMVFSAELFNSAIENLADEVTQNYNKTIKKVKDLSAAGVLIASISAAIIGILVFLPALLEKFKQ